MAAAWPSATGRRKSNEPQEFGLGATAGTSFAIIAFGSTGDFVFLPTFKNPLVLLLLLAVPPLVWWWLRQGRGALRFPSTRLVEELAARRAQRSRRWGAGLRAAGLALVVVALSGPRWPDPGTRLPTHGIAIALVLDVSRSMASQDFAWKDKPLRRIDAAKRVLRLFVKGGEAGGTALFGRPTDLVALVTFATRPETACPLTLNHDVLLEILDTEEPRMLATEGATNMGDALAWALHRLQQAGARRKVVILLTDGEHNVPAPALTPRQAAQLAGNLGIPIYAIGAGTGLPSDESPKSAEEAVKAKKALEDIAALTKGRHFQASDAEALLEICGQIDRLERQEIQSFQYRRYYEAFAWFALAAFVCWLTVTVLDSTVWRKVP